jgi:hypothetical protein
MRDTNSVIIPLYPHHAARLISRLISLPHETTHSLFASAYGGILPICTARTHYHKGVLVLVPSTPSPTSGYVRFRPHGHYTSLKPVSFSRKTLLHGVWNMKYWTPPWDTSWKCLKLSYITILTIHQQGGIKENNDISQDTNCPCKKWNSGSEYEARRRNSL